MSRERSAKYVYAQTIPIKINGYPKPVDASLRTSDNKNRKRNYSVSGTDAACLC